MEQLFSTPVKHLILNSSSDDIIIHHYYFSCICEPEVVIISQRRRRTSIWALELSNNGCSFQRPRGICPQPQAALVPADRSRDSKKKKKVCQSSPCVHVPPLVPLRWVPGRPREQKPAWMSPSSAPLGHHHHVHIDTRPGLLVSWSPPPGCFTLQRLCADFPRTRKVKYPEKNGSKERRWGGAVNDYFWIEP